MQYMGMRAQTLLGTNRCADAVCGCGVVCAELAAPVSKFLCASAVLCTLSGPVSLCARAPYLQTSGARPLAPPPCPPTAICASASTRCAREREYSRDGGHWSKTDGAQSTVRAQNERTLMRAQEAAEQAKKASAV